MPVNRHQNARTTPALRRERRESPRSLTALARRYHPSKPTVRQWRRRAETADRAHGPQRWPTTRSAPQEAIMVALRQMLLLPLDDRLAVPGAGVGAGVSRSGLDRGRRRSGVSDRAVRRPQEATPRPRARPSRTTHLDASL